VKPGVGITRTIARMILLIAPVMSGSHPLMAAINEPVRTETGRLSGVHRAPLLAALSGPSFRASPSSLLPRGRANAVFLMANSLVTSQTIAIDGGLTLVSRWLVGGGSRS
jgi:hypothetical protein